MINTNNPDNRAVIYARFSSHNQRDESIDAQERARREYAKHHKLQVIEVYADRENQVQIQSVRNFSV